MKKKIYLLVMVLTVFFNIYCYGAVYEKTDTQTLAQGVTLNNITKFTENGWLYLNVIKVDLTNKSVKLDVIKSESGVSHFDTVKNMANYANAIAAINADYFARRPNTTQRGQSIGFWGSNGNILMSSADDNLLGDKMASFVLSTSNDIVYTYLKDEILLHSENTDETIYVSDINKYLPLEAPCCIFTSNWGNTSIGNSEGKEMIELVVVDDKVVEIRNNQEGIKIPENGYVVSGYGTYGEKLLNNFSIGSKISYSVNLNLDLDSMKMAVSGGSMLVENGNIPNFTHTIYGKNKLSAIGSSKDNNTVYLITANNINGTTEGLTQKEFATILKNLGMYNAVTLDGGGSTTMVAKELYSDKITSINVKDGSYLRPVVNSIGVYSDTTKTNLSELQLSLDNKYVFENNSTGFTIKGHDTNYNNVEIDYSDLEFSFSNSNAKYANGKIIALKEGTVIVTVTYKGISTTATLNILGDIHSLKIVSKSNSISQGSSTTLSLIGTDKNGFSSPIENNLVKWSVSGVGTISSEGVFASTNSGVGIISASINDIKSYLKLGVSSSQTSIIDSFEKISGNYSGYPSTTKGSISLCNDKVKDGKNSLKLEYNFNTEDIVRGAYYDYSIPLNIPENCSEIGIWIYNPSSNTNSLKSQYKNSSGTTNIEVLCEEMNFKGWKYFTYSKPSNVNKIVSIYVAQSDLNEKNSSYICIDSIKATYYGYEETNTDIPMNTSKTDIYNKENVDNCFTLSLIEKINSPKTLFDKILNNKLLQGLNESNLILFTSNNTYIPDNLTVKTIKNSGYNLTNSNDYSIITLDISKNGIKNTNFSQWENLISDFSNLKKNVIIVLNKNLNDFSDNLEKQLFLNLLIEQKNKANGNYWIIQQGNATENTNYNGLKILTLGNLALSSNNIIDNVENYSYINIYIKNDNIYYDIKKVF